MRFSRWLVAGALLFSGTVWSAPPEAPVRQDITVAADGSGDFRTIQAALESLPRSNSERKIILIKDGLYKEKIRVDASCVTLRGQSRQGTRIEFAQLEDDFQKQKDDLGRAVINLNKANDVVIENLTAANTATNITAHAITIFGTGDRTVLLNCDLLSEGADTVALWRTPKGRYYFAGCHFRGASDYVCPRGWCYATNCTFFGTKKGGSATWHDGSNDPDKKFVLRNCKFDGVEGWNLSRHLVDSELYYLDCSFSKTLADKAPFRVVYRNDPKKTAEVNSEILWGERFYYHNCHRDGGAYAWHQDNLASAANSVAPEEITPAWTFAGEWDPERKSPPSIQQVAAQGPRITVTFDEPVSVRGKPRLLLKTGPADYVNGGGTETLVFNAPNGKAGEAQALDPNGATILACQAGIALRVANLALPAAPDKPR